MTKELRLKILFYLRREKKTIVDLAKYLKVTKQYVSAMLLGQDNISISYVLKIAKFLNVNPKYLIVLYKFKDGSRINIDNKRFKKALIPLRFANNFQYYKYKCKK